MCIENHFDKAQSMMIYADKKTEVLRHLKVGCETYKLYEPEELSGHYFYRSIQIDFLESKFSCIKNKIWDYEYRILNDEKITYKLFFRVLAGVSACRIAVGGDYWVYWLKFQLSW